MSDGPDLLERTRMALAEVGEDPTLVQWHPTVDGAIWASVLIDCTTAWRAAELARSVDPASRQHCLACVNENALRGDNGMLARCTAYLPLTEDCGVDRSTP